MKVENVGWKPMDVGGGESPSGGGRAEMWGKKLGGHHDWSRSRPHTRISISTNNENIWFTFSFYICC